MRKMLALLLKTRLKILMNSFIRGKLSAKIGALFALAIAAFFAFLSFFLGMVLFGVINKNEGLPMTLAIVNVSLLGLMVFLLFSSLSVSFYSMYTSPDLSIWITAPVPLRVVFTEKLLEVIAGTSGIFAIMFFPALVAMGIALDAGILYYLLLVPVSLLFLFIPAGLGMTLTICVMRFIRVDKAKEILGGLGALLGFGGYAVSQLAPQFMPDPGKNKELAVGRLFTFLDKFNWPLSPSKWTAEILVQLSHGNLKAVLLPVALLLLTAAGVIIIAVMVNEKAYLAGLAKISEVRVKTKKRTARRGKGFADNFHGPVWAVLFKDFKSLLRNFEELVQFFFPLFFLVVIMFKIKMGINSEDPYNLDGYDALIAAAMFIFVMSFFGMRLSITAFGRERLNYWVLHLSPVSKRKIVLGKIIVASLPSMVLGTLAYVVTAVMANFPVGLSLLSLLLLIFSLIGINALGVLIGALFPLFDAKNPRQMVKGLGGLVYFLACGIYIGIIFGLFALPQLGRLLNIDPLILWLVSLAIFSAGVAASTYLFIILAAKRLDSMEFGF